MVRPSDGVVEYGNMLGYAKDSRAALAAIYQNISTSVGALPLDTEWVEYPHIISGPDGTLGWYGTATKSAKQRVRELESENRQLRDDVAVMRRLLKKDR